jgi:WD40 repeat protein
VIVEGVGSNAQYAEGRVLFLREQTLMAQPFDLDRRATHGEAVPLGEHVQTVLTSGKAGFFSVSANGLLLYQAGHAEGPDQLTWFDRMGNKRATLGEPGAISTIEFSPDRKRLGATVVDGSNLDVWSYDVARGTRGRFTFDTAEDRNSIWSPDGRTIIFDSRRKGHLDMYRRPSDASSAEELLYADDHDKVSTSWSPDGKFLLYTRSGTKTATDVWVLPLAAEHASPKAETAKPFAFVQTSFNDQNGKFSPDGHWVAYSSGESGRLEVYVARFPGPGAKQQLSIAGGDYPRWRSDGREIFYLSLDLRLMAAEVSVRGNTFEVGQVYPLFGPAPINRGYLYDVSADGQKFLLALQPEQTISEPLTLMENWSAGLRR